MKTLISLLLLALCSNAFAMNIPFKITSQHLDIEYVRGVMKYEGSKEHCPSVSAKLEAEITDPNEAVLSFKRSIYNSKASLACRFTKFSHGTFALKLKGKNEIPFSIAKGKLMNNYSRSNGNAVVLWGAWVNGDCTFRDEEYIHCDAGSHNSWSRPDEPFTLYVSPSYPMFQWNITEDLR